MYYIIIIDFPIQWISIIHVWSVCGICRPSGRSMLHYQQVYPQLPGSQEISIVNVSMDNTHGCPQVWCRHPQQSAGSLERTWESTHSGQRVRWRAPKVGSWFDGEHPQLLAGLMEYPQWSVGSMEHPQRSMSSMEHPEWSADLMGSTHSGQRVRWRAPTVFSAFDGEHPQRSAGFMDSTYSGQRVQWRAPTAVSGFDGEHPQQSVGSMGSTHIGFDWVPSGVSGFNKKSKTIKYGIKIG